MDSFLTGIRVVLSLGVVFALLWYLSKRMRARTTSRRRTAAVQVLGKAALGGKATVVVVEAAGRRMVLGVTEHNVSMLHDEDAPEEEEVPEPAARPTAAPALPDFGSLLGRTQWSVPRRRAHVDR